MSSQLTNAAGKAGYRFALIALGIGMGASELAAQSGRLGALLGRGKTEECRGPGRSPMLVIEDPWFLKGDGAWGSLEKELAGRRSDRETAEVRLTAKGAVSAPSKPVPGARAGLIRATIDPAARLDRLTDAALAIRQLVAAGKRWACDAPDVSIVAYGSAGLLVRAYLQSPQYARDVNAFVTIATPHRGAVLAVPGISADRKLQRSCLGDFGVELPSSTSVFGMMDPSSELLRSLNQGTGSFRPLPQGLYVQEIVTRSPTPAKLGSKCGGVVGAYAAKSSSGPPGSAFDGFSTTDQQTIPEEAFAGRRRQAEKVREIPETFGAAHGNRLVSLVLVDVIDRAPAPAGSQRTVSDTTVQLIFPRSQDLTSVVLRGVCFSDCKSDDSLTVFVKGASASLDRRLEGVRKISITTLPIFGVQSGAGRIQGRALKLDHASSATTFLLARTDGVMPVVLERAGVFPAGAGLMPEDSLCIQGDARVLGEGQSATMKFLSTLSLCEQVREAQQRPTVSISLDPRLRMWPSWTHENVDKADAKPEQMTADSAVLTSAEGTKQHSRIFTPLGRYVLNGVRRLRVRATVSGAQPRAPEMELGWLTGGKDRWVTIRSRPAENENSWIFDVELPLEIARADAVDQLGFDIKWSGGTLTLGRIDFLP